MTFDKRPRIYKRIRNKSPHPSLNPEHQNLPPYPYRTVQNLNDAYKLLMFHVAQYANMAYCTETVDNSNGRKRTTQKPKSPSFEIVFDKRHNRVIIYFVGEMLSRMQWETREVKLARITFKLLKQGKLYLNQTYVDSVWNEDVKKMKGEIIEKLDPFLSFDLNFVGHGVGGVTTFGQPRIGDVSLAIFLNQFVKVQRITHSNDYVPRSFHPPPKFLHHDREFWLTHDECDCLNKKTIEGGYVYFNCRGYRPKWGATHGENQGTIDDLESWAHVGPYFGVTMGRCDNQV
ncbi:hypothetical protein G9A89_006218 [Geosiphon pyriformis]|nr:hypothetical protein G9A89_006218 [Geosiphon pyriformis]